ncbi:hypothetical protein [Streptomyces brevispora]|uniref:hypothetical protein n=1 Tax=Streptomyces brevispora TaxID=887462 RepID=UPI00380BD39D
MRKSRTARTTRTVRTDPYGTYRSCRGHRSYVAEGRIPPGVRPSALSGTPGTVGEP